MISCTLAVDFDATAQKRKRKKNEETVTNEIQAPVSMEDKRKAELYHAEAEKYYILDDYAKAFVVYQKSLKYDPQNATAFCE